MSGNKNQQRQLWYFNNNEHTVPNNENNKNMINNIIITGTRKQLALFYHHAAFSPVRSTFIRAIQNGAFKSWPGLIVDLIRKHLPDQPATALGHMKLIKKGIASTKTQINKDDDYSPNEITEKNKRTNIVFAVTRDLNDLSDTIYTDLCGRFPHTLSTGNKYVYILYEYDSNYILAEPMKNHSDAEMCRVYDKALDRLKQAGFHPQMHYLDNEASQALKNIINKENIWYQLPPPGNKRKNNAERAIQTYKNHYISGLATVHPDFPLNLWDQLIEHGEITLNLMRQSRQHPHLSSYEHVCGHFDYNATPLVPPGQRAVAHIRTENRASWGFRGEIGWYAGPALEHYRCHRIYIPKTRSTRINDTVTFYPHGAELPTVTPTELAAHAALELTKILTNPPPQTQLVLPTDEHKDALLQLARIFYNSASNDKTPPTAPVQQIQPINQPIPTEPLTTQYRERPVLPRKAKTSPSNSESLRVVPTEPPRVTRPPPPVLPTTPTAKPVPVPVPPAAKIPTRPKRTDKPLLPTYHRQTTKPTTSPKHTICSTASTILHGATRCIRCSSQSCHVPTDRSSPELHKIVCFP